MTDWLANNSGTIAVTLMLTAAVVLIIAKLIRDKKEGRSSCGCNCAHCAMAGQCHKTVDPTKEHENRCDCGCQEKGSAAQAILESMTRKYQYNH